LASGTILLYSTDGNRMPMKCIIVVEDEPLIMDLIAILLERAGYEVVRAATAEEALPLAESRPPDLVLMDIALPGIDGLAATRILKSSPATRGVPVVALTAQAMRADAEAAARAGCDGFIAKPISTRGFLRQVEEYLGLAGGKG
jgi:two-component system, cell cycle response regulator DivK